MRALGLIVGGIFALAASIAVGLQRTRLLCAPARVNPCDIARSVLTRPASTAVLRVTCQCRSPITPRYSGLREQLRALIEML